MAYDSTRFTAFQVPTVSEWNQIHDNTDALQDGTAIDAGAITGAKLGTPVAFKAYDSGGTSLLNVTTAKINFATEAYDRGGNYNTSTSRFVAPFDGDYLFTAAIGSFTSSTRTILDIYVNGAVAGRGSDASGRQAIASVPLNLTAGDYVEVFGYQGSGGTLSNSNLQHISWFEGHLIGRTD